MRRRIGYRVTHQGSRPAKERLMTEERDAVTLLERDHRNVEGLFQQYEAAEDVEEKTKVAHEVVHELAVHGEIEELVVYPRLRLALQDGDRLADEAIKEHVQMKQTLDEIDSMSADEVGFDERMQTLVGEVRQHVQEEESELLPRVRQTLTPEERGQLSESMEGARAMVPTRPHPKAPTSPGAKVAAGPPTALVDRVRDAVRTAVE
jgi:hemerythrin superfamily protein